MISAHKIGMMLPHPLWSVWRDLTWARRDRSAWLAKMQRYYNKGGTSRKMAIARVQTLMNDGAWDWDDNVPVAWASVLKRKWKLPQ